MRVRAWDREHAVALVKQDADYVVRETFESAMLLGREAVRALGASDLEADAYMQEVRRRDAERFALETAGGIFTGRDLILGNMGPRSSRDPAPASEARVRVERDFAGVGRVEFRRFAIEVGDLDLG